MKIILLNGPPGCGKDTAAKIINKKLHGFSYQYKMSLPLKEACHNLLGLQGTLEELEPLKDLAIKFLIKKDSNHWSLYNLVNDKGEMTLRQFYIYISENVMKPLFGDDIFGRLAVENLKQCHHDVVTISDSGFAPEAKPIIDYFGKENICLSKLYRTGKDFSGDSRGYIDLPVDKILDINNNSSVDDFEKDLWNKITKNFLIGLC